MIPVILEAIFASLLPKATKTSSLYIWEVESLALLFAKSNQKLTTSESKVQNQKRICFLFNKTPQSKWS